MTNLIKNPSFEESWTDILVKDAGYMKNQAPNGWEISWLTTGQIYRDEPVGATPECVHKLARQLPKAEQRGAKDAIILDGDVVYKMFSRNAFAAFLSQTVTGLIPRAQVKITVPVRCHHNGMNDPYGVEASLRANGEYVWLNTPQLPHREWASLQLKCKVDLNGELHIKLSFDSKWSNAVDFFVDDIHSEYLDADLKGLEPVHAPIQEVAEEVDWKAEVWPTHFPPIIWHTFGSNDGIDYTKYGQFGHCGVDLKSGEFGEILAAADGIVELLQPPDDGLGNNIVIRHNDRFATRYAHLSQFKCAVGDRVKAGDVIGISGRTGNCYGPSQHLHFAVWDHEQGHEGCYKRYVDPHPYLQHLISEPSPAVIPEEKKANTFDLLDYLCGDGRIYAVGNADGGQEIFQSRKNGVNFFQIKNDKAEAFWYTSKFIYRYWDSSPGGGRYYTVQDGGEQRGAVWIPRIWQIGQSFSNGKHVQFYTDDGRKSSLNSGDVTDTMTFVSHHDEYKFATGTTLNDVVKLRWAAGEDYLYARGWGLVGWQHTHQDSTPAWSAVKQIEKDARDLQFKVPKGLS